MNYNIETKRHSLAHVLAMAVLEKRPDTKLGIGPVIENGFYYDFEFNGHAPGPECFPKLEQAMADIIKKDFKFERKEISAEKAKKIFVEQPYKLELIDELISGSRTSAGSPTFKNAEKIFIYKSGNFTDLCAGSHVDSMKDLASTEFKLLKTAGAYWRGSEKNPMLTRIYVVAFETEKELEEYLEKIEEAEKNDHRKIGKDLDLFVFSDLVGKGLPLFTSKGATIKRELERFVVNEEIKRGYEHVITPPLAKIDLYKKSGHYPYYKDTMYPLMKVDEDELMLRPMTCPHHFMLYKSKMRSYKELPIKIAELSPQFRYEKSGELSGLTRVRTFCLADAHIFTAADRAKSAIADALNLIEYINATFGLKKGEDYRYRLSMGNRKDETKYYKDDTAWNEAEKILRDLLKERNEPYFEAPGEAAFYGPKIDIQMKNSYGKEETAFTVQYDFVMPKRFDLKYIDADGKEKQPIVIHRSSIGAIERTMAFLIEHFAGDFPLWLAPIQIKIITVSEKVNDYAKKIAEKFSRNNFRVEIDDSNETMNKKIRGAETQKIPYLLIVGEKEEKSKTVAVRQRQKGNIGAMKINDFIKKIDIQIKQRSL